MSDVLAEAAVAVAPMQAGSGMQFKVLEAMACALPVVTTTLGLGDIKAIPGEHLMLADGAACFAAAVAALLKSPETSTRLGQNARRFILEGHSWQSAAVQVEKIYTEIPAAK